MNTLPFSVGDIVVHVKDPFQERHEVIEHIEFVDGDRIVLKSERTGEIMPLVASRIGLAGWKKVS